MNIFYTLKNDICLLLNLMSLELMCVLESARGVCCMYHVNFHVMVKLSMWKICETVALTEWQV